MSDNVKAMTKLATEMTVVEIANALNDALNTEDLEELSDEILVRLNDRDPEADDHSREDDGSSDDPA